MRFNRLQALRGCMSPCLGQGGEYEVDPGCLTHSLTPAEREQFDRARLHTRRRRPDHQSKSRPIRGQSTESTPSAPLAERAAWTFPAGCRYPISLTLDPAFIDLIDNPRVFPKVWGISGLESVPLPHALPGHPSGYRSRASARPDVRVAPGLARHHARHSGAGSAAPLVA